MQRDPAHTPDTLTLVAIGAMAYAVATLIHEGAGHGTACVLGAGKPLVLSSVHFACDDAGMSAAGRVLLAAGGTLANFAAGALLLIALRATPRASGHLRYFLWLAMAVNFMAAAGYFLYSGVGSIGDWAEVVRGRSPAWAWRAGLTVSGGILYIGVVLLVLQEMAPLIGADDRRLVRARQLAVVPYLAGGILSCIAGLFNPVGMILVAISAAAASFGGTSGLAWMTGWLKSDRFPVSAESPPDIDRRWSWIVAGAIVTIIFIGVLGPGIRLS